MASVSLDELLRQSQQLAGPFPGPDLPRLHIGLDQLESQSRILAGRAAAPPSTGTSGIAPRSTHNTVSLASAGADADKLARNIEMARANNAYEPLRPLDDTDVAGYLRHEHQQVILAALEEGRRNTQRALCRTIDRSLDTSWDAQKRRIIEDLGSFASVPQEVTAAATGGCMGPALASSSLQMHSKMLRYVRVVQRLNDSRLAREPIPLAHAYKYAVTQLHASAGGAGGARLLESWSALEHLVREHDVINGQFTQGAVVEREYAPDYSDPQIYLASSRGLALRQKLIQSSLRYLEMSFGEVVAESSQGSVVPGVDTSLSDFYMSTALDRVGQYCSRKLRGPDQQWYPDLELIQTDGWSGPIWACIYLLVRIGEAKEALKLAQQVENVLRKTDHSFVGMFQAWLESPGRTLPKSLRERLYTEYTSRVCPLGSNARAVDPYKLTLYRLVGRFEVRVPFPPALTPDTSQWLWLQLAMVRELPIEDTDMRPNGSVPTRDTYTLGDVADTILRSDDVVSGREDTTPYGRFKLLLLVGQFERAIAFLASRPTYNADAVQFAITLSYYGLLRVPPSSVITQADYLRADTSDPHLAAGGIPRTLGVTYFDFARLIQRYICPLIEQAPQEALQHVYLVALNSDAPSPIGQEQVAVCLELAKSVVLESKDYYTLLGDPKNDGSVSPGSLMKYAKLLRASSPDSLFRSIVDAAAAAAENTQPRDAILLYLLAGKNDQVIAVLSQELGTYLFDPSVARPAEVDPGLLTRSTSLQAAQDLPTMAREILASYERKLHAPHHVSSQGTETVRLLLELTRALGAFRADQPEKALALVEATDLIPLRANAATVTQRAQEWEGMDPALRNNLGDILIMIMTILATMHSTLRASLYARPDGQRKVSDLRTQARTLLSFAGIVRHLISPAAYAQLVSLSPQ